VKQSGGSADTVHQYPDRPGYEESISRRTFPAGSGTGAIGSVREFDPESGRLHRFDVGFFQNQHDAPPRFVPVTALRVEERRDGYASRIKYSTNNMKPFVNVVVSEGSREEVLAAINVVENARTFEIELILKSIGALPADAEVSLADSWESVLAFRESEKDKYVGTFDLFIEGEEAELRRTMAYDAALKKWYPVAE
jgi:hypothetical protein